MAGASLVEQLLTEVRDNPGLRVKLYQELQNHEKISKDEANYREAEHDGSGRDSGDNSGGGGECSSCTHFTKYSGDAYGCCAIVAGTIDPEWTCDYYDRGAEPVEPDEPTSDAGDLGRAYPG